MKRFNAMLAVAVLCILGLQTAWAKDKITNIPNGVQVETPALNVKVQFYAQGTVRVEKWLPGKSFTDTSLVVLPSKPSNLNITVKEEAAQISLTSSDITVIVNKADGSVSYFNTNKEVLLKENGAPSIQPFELRNEKAFSVKQNFTLTPDEAIYGLGQHQSGYFNYRGKTVKLVQSNTEAVSPFLISTNNYGILWDNYSKTIFDDNSTGTSLYSDVADYVNYYFIAGTTMDKVIAGYRNLTGQAPMYGKWAYGYWQSKEHYKTRAELLGIAKQYRDRKIPIDNIIQDWNYWPTNLEWGQLYFDEKKFPNPAEMIDSLHKINFHLMITIWCCFGPNTPVYKDMDQKGFLYPTVGWAKFKYYDVYNPAARDLFWKYTNEGLFSKGMDGWWMDSTEPDIVNAATKESSEYEMKRMADNHAGSFARYLNPYSLLATEGVYKHQRAVTDQKRVYILTRSTFAGQQRAAAATWSGDIGANWDIYKNQIAAGLNHSMSGIPYWTFDIGSFLIGAYGGVFLNGKDPAYQEYYTRMFQFGTFCPIFRSHGSDTPREIWEFGDFSSTLVKFDNLRYRLMPYIYSLAADVTRSGYTIMRGLAMDFPQDKKVYNINDQFMFGPSIMVCPVTEYMLHRPPMSTIPVDASNFRTAEGKVGLNASYYKDTEYKQLGIQKVDSGVNVNWYATGRPNYVTDSTLSIRWTGKLVPQKSGKYQFHIKCFGPKRIYLDGKELPYIFSSNEAYTDKIDLVAGKEYDFKVESENGTPGALRVELFWKTPDIFAQESVKENKDQTRDVYLPSDSKWIDFWTGKSILGGQIVKADALIDKIPLLVKAGSIIPMGPFVQYTTEKSYDTLEIRVYPGADGNFTLYEDENDNYNYEKGKFSTIGFHWENAKRILTIDDRQGSFAGMLQKRTFNIVVVDTTKGYDIGLTANPNKSIAYSGQKVQIKL